MADALGALEVELEEARREFERYFLGVEKRLPARIRDEINRKIKRFETGRDAVVRFRHQNLVQRLGLLEQYWNRTLRAIEEGTYERDVQRADRRAPEPRVEAAPPDAQRRAASAIKATEAGDAAADFLESLGIPGGRPRGPGEGAVPVAMRGVSKGAEPTSRIGRSALPEGPPVAMRGSAVREVPSLSRAPGVGVGSAAVHPAPAASAPVVPRPAVSLPPPPQRASDSAGAEARPRGGSVPGESRRAPGAVSEKSDRETLRALVPPPVPSALRVQVPVRTSGPMSTLPDAPPPSPPPLPSRLPLPPPLPSPSGPASRPQNSMGPGSFPPLPRITGGSRAPQAPAPSVAPPARPAAPPLAPVGRAEAPPLPMRGAPKSGQPDQAPRGRTPRPDPK